MNKKGKIYAVSIGHCPHHITPEAQKILHSIDVVAGHPGFIEIAREFLKDTIEFIDNRETRKYADTFEIAQQNRVSACVQEALKGKKVAILSGGDTGIWGEAGFFVEARMIYDGAFDLVIVPGVSGIVAAAARVGAPLMNGFALIALGDEDTPFNVVECRLKGAAIGGLPIVLYKVIIESYTSPEFYPQDKYPELYPPQECTKIRLGRTYEILSEYINPATPMAIITDMYNQTSNHRKTENMLGAESGQEEIIITEFVNFLKYMDYYRFLTTIIIGDDTTKMWNNFIYTPQWNYHWIFDSRMLDRVQKIPYLKDIKDLYAEQ